MKKFMTLLSLIVAISLLGYNLVSSDTATPTINVSAVVMAGTPSFTYKIYKAPNGGNIDFTTPYTSMNFDAFTVVQKASQAAQWVSVDHWAVVVYADGRGSRYYIKSTGAGPFTSGANTLVDGSFGCIPVYSSSDMWDLDNDGTPETPQGTLPTGATVGNKFKAITGGIGVGAQTAYTSENPGTPRIIQVRYAFPPYNNDGTNPYTNYQAIATSQASGTYTGGQVKVTISTT